MNSIIPILMLAGLTAVLSLAEIGIADAGEVVVAESPAPLLQVPPGMVRGTVLETMDSGGYTYVLLETDRDKRWIASTQTAVAVGDLVQAGEGMAMRDFHSSTLNRSFDVVYFVPGLTNLSAPQTPGGQTGGVMPEEHPVAAMPSANPGVAGTGNAKVAEIEPGKNIAYVYANKDALAGQQISLRGKVVKYNGGIMGRNWIHIQDGSGDAAGGSSDLTVTSQDAAAVGETVVVTGTVVLNKDFGAGYSYPVLMEEASVAAE